MVERILRSLGRADDVQRYRPHRQARKTVAQAAVAIWTDHDGQGTNLFFKALNRVLLHNDLASLQSGWMPLVRLNTHG